MDNLITLTLKEMQRCDIIKKLIEKRLTEEEARKQIGLKSVRQVRRIKARIKKEGPQGIIHRNRGRPSNKKFNKEFLINIISIIKENYHDFKPTFVTEKLFENHNIKIGRETIRKLMTKNGLWKPRSRKKPKKRHVWRQRKPNYGEMQQFDGSYHYWFEDRGDECCLLLSVDDATGKITHAKFDKNEGTIAVFKFWLEYYKKHGLPISIYLDKFSTYKINHKSAVDNKDLITQFQRASNQVGIKLITANSPEAKGRVERMNQTLQDRLVKELRLANISTIKEANKFLEKYIPKFNKQFAFIPQNQANLHKKVNKELNNKLPQIFSIQSQRKINNDYTIMFKNKFFQLEEKQPTTVFKKDTVIVEEHLNEEIKINLKSHYLSYYELLERPKKQINLPVAALTRKKPDFKPPKDHPWRKFVYSKNNKKLTNKLLIKK